MLLKAYACGIFPMAESAERRFAALYAMLDRVADVLRELLLVSCLIALQKA